MCGRPCGARFWGAIEKPETVKEASFAHNARYIQRAEELGFESTLLLDRSLNSIKGVGAPVLEAWITAAALAPITERIELIIAAKSAYRHPSLVAQMGANIDCISGGRFAINIVSGWWGQENEMAGIPFPPHDERYDLSEEVMHILKSYWTKERFSFQGRYFRDNRRRHRAQARPQALAHVLFRGRIDCRREAGRQGRGRFPVQRPSTHGRASADGRREP